VKFANISAAAKQDFTHTINFYQSFLGLGAKGIGRYFLTEIWLRLSLKTAKPNDSGTSNSAIAPREAIPLGLA